MIISASRRTDIPAFYAPWFINRVRTGYCEVANPFNPKQISRVSLLPKDVDAIIFWTRNPTPLIPYLKELDARGLNYAFLFTILDYPQIFERRTPPLRLALYSFQELSKLVGPARVHWRYDPICLSQGSDVDFHLKAYARIAENLRFFTNKSIVSFVEDYKKTRKRMEKLNEFKPETPEKNDIARLLTGLRNIATENSMELTACAQELDLTAYGVQPNRCIDAAELNACFNINITHKKDPSQRKACACSQSKDIGAYNTCLFGCRYCYATTSFARARYNYNRHDPHAPTLLAPAP